MLDTKKRARIERQIAKAKSLGPALDIVPAGPLRVSTDKRSYMLSAPPAPRTNKNASSWD